MLILALRWLAVPIGILAYLSCFMYEDAEGRWQNRIENVWVAIDDREKRSGSRTAALFNAVAVLVTRGFNRMFGRNLFSLQFLGVSISYSFAGMFLIMGYILLHLSFLALGSGATPVPESVSKGVGAAALLGFGCFVVGFVCFVLAALPSLLPSFWSVGLSMIPGLLVAAWVVRALQLHRLFGDQLALSAAFLASLLSDVLLLTLTRFTVRMISAKTNAPRIAVSVLIQLGVVALLVVAPVKVALYLTAKFGNHPTSLALFSFFMGGLNIFTGILSCMFIIVLFFVLLHKIFWPALGRLFYPLARYQVIRNHKAMATIGTACLLFAFPLMWSPVSSLLKWMAR